MNEKKKIPKRFKPNYFYSIISMSLVLFMLGLLALVFSSGKKLADQFKENLEFTVIIKDNVSEKKVLALQDSLARQPWVKRTEYISKEQAAKIFTQDNDEDFKDLLDYNPLFASINLKLPAAYTSQDSINHIEKLVMQHPEVSEFYYEHKLVSVMNDNLHKIGWIIIAISLLLLAVAITVLDSTVRLSMYANRLLIRSMQLVGATSGFITRPFLSRSMIHGLIASLAAILLLTGFMRLAISQLPELRALQDYTIIGLIFCGLIVTGLLFSFISTYLAVRKYLRMRVEELY